MKKKKIKNKIDVPFTAIEHKITDSLPWKDLPIKARYLYFEIRKKWGGLDRGHIEFTHKEAREFMVGKTFRTHRDYLIENGFIDLVERGGLWGNKAVLALSDRWKKWGTRDFIVVSADKIFP
ncbi:unnamed protein product, partial [marine sediment metagenome]